MGPLLLFRRKRAKVAPGAAQPPPQTSQDNGLQKATDDVAGTGAGTGNSSLLSAAAAAAAPAAISPPRCTDSASSMDQAATSCPSSPNSSTRSTCSSSSARAIVGGLTSTVAAAAAMDQLAPSNSCPNSPSSSSCSGSVSRPGEVFWTDGRAKQMPLFWRAVAMVTLLAFISWLYGLLFVMALAPFSRLAAVVTMAAWGTLLLPCQPVGWKRFMASPLLALWRRYFSFATVYEQKLDPARSYMFCDFPHGAFPISQLLGLSVRHLACWEGERFYGMAADSVFRIPLWRHVYTWLGIVPASRDAIKQHLKWGSVGLTPGGIAEMYLAGGSADHVYIRSRKGFVAVAVEEGVDLVPVYHFGNTACLSFGPRFLEPWGRRWRFSLGLLFGVAGLPIPRRVRLLMTVGAPVPVTKTPRSDPSFQAVVDETHGRFMAALAALYESHQGRYGWADHPLVMH